MNVKECVEYEMEKERSKVMPVVYDVEVLRGPDEVEGGWENPEAMGFGTAVAYDVGRDRYHLYGPNDKQKLIADLGSRDVISFNGIRFDNRVLMGNDYLSEDGLWDNIDLLLLAVCAKFPGCSSVKEAEDKHGQKAVHDNTLGLDGLAHGTLGRGKAGHGAHAPKLIAKKNWAGVFEYNLEDVRLTYKLWAFAKQYGFLVDRGGNVLRITV